MRRIGHEMLVRRRKFCVADICFIIDLHDSGSADPCDGMWAQRNVELRSVRQRLQLLSPSTRSGAFDPRLELDRFGMGCCRSLDALTAVVLTAVVTAVAVILCAGARSLPSVHSSGHHLAECIGSASAISSLAII